MTNVSYEVRKDGFKGILKVYTLVEARRKAGQIGGTYKAIYTDEKERPLTVEELALRQKRMAHFGLV